jgi:hypothetical protein
MNAPTSVFLSEAHVSTAEAPRYLRMLCKHFRHKSPTTFDEMHGRIEFPAGMCELDAAATAGTLKIRILTNDPVALERLEGVVGSHLKRFAPKEPLEVRWTRSV